MPQRAAVDVATFFAHELKGATSHLKLQKLCYYVQGYSLAQHGFPFFSDPVEATIHGPSVRALRAPKVLQPEELRMSPCPEFSSEELEVLREVLRDLGGFSGWELREKTRDEHPWRAMYGRRDATIPHDLMRQWFSEVRQGKTESHTPDTV